MLFLFVCAVRERRGTLFALLSIISLCHQQSEGISSGFWLPAVLLMVLISAGAEIITKYFKAGGTLALMRAVVLEHITEKSV